MVTHARTADLAASEVHAMDSDTDSSASSTMKAIAQTHYGSTDVLHLQTVAKPVPKDNEVLIKIHASSINAGDWHLMRGTPFLIRLMFGGLFKPTIRTIGMDVAGQVEAVGDKVTQFKSGDEVFGDLSSSGFGGFAEYACAPEEAIAHKPSTVTLEEAAAIPAAALAALQAIRDCGTLQPGQRVLINGASGGVGSFAVQIAKALGAEVTAVCHGSKMEMMNAIAPDHVIDYTQTDVTQADRQYDLIVDAAAYRPFSAYLPILVPGGTYVVIGGATAAFFQAMLLGGWKAKRQNRTVKCLESVPNAADLNTIRAMVEEGEISPQIDRYYSLGEVPEAMRYVESRQVRGKVVIRM